MEWCVCEIHSITHYTGSWPLIYNQKSIRCNLMINTTEMAVLPIFWFSGIPLINHVNRIPKLARWLCPLETIQQRDNGRRHFLKMGNTASIQQGSLYTTKKMKNDWLYMISCSSWLSQTQMSELWRAPINKSSSEILSCYVVMLNVLHKYMGLDAQNSACYLG